MGSVTRNHQTKTLFVPVTNIKLDPAFAVTRIDVAITNQQIPNKAPDDFDKNDCPDQ